MNDLTYCVLWDRERNRLEMAPLDTLLQLNNASFLDDRPARALLRTSMTEEQARVFIRGYAALMARRSIARIDAEDAAAVKAKATT